MMKEKYLYALATFVFTSTTYLAMGCQGSIDRDFINRHEFLEQIGKRITIEQAQESLIPVYKALAILVKESHMLEKRLEIKTSKKGK